MTTSSKNTDAEQLTNPPVIHQGSLAKVAEPTVGDIQVGELQGKLAKSEDDRKEERFLWFMVSGALFVLLSFMAGGAAAGGVISLIYIGMLLVLSRRWGFEDLWEALYAAKSLLPGGKEKDEE